MGRAGRVGWQAAAGPHLMQRLLLVHAHACDTCPTSFAQAGAEAVIREVLVLAKEGDLPIAIDRGSGTQARRNAMRFWLERNTGSHLARRRVALFCISKLATFGMSSIEICEYLLFKPPTFSAIPDLHSARKEKRYIRLVFKIRRLGVISNQCFARLAEALAKI